MGTKAILPLIDIVFLTLGSVLAAMTQMEKVTAIPVSIATVGCGAAVIQHGNFAILAVTPTDLMLNGKSISEDLLETHLAGKNVVLRVDGSLPTQRTWTILAKLHQAGCNVSAEVKEGSDQTSNTHYGGN